MKQKWNPFCSNLPYTTFAHHPLHYTSRERETTIYNVDDFYDTLVQAVTAVYKSKRPGEALRTEEVAIIIESYANVASMVFNQSHIGFYRERGGVSFWGVWTIGSSCVFVINDLQAGGIFWGLWFISVNYWKDGSIPTISAQSPFTLFYSSTKYFNTALQDLHKICKNFKWIIRAPQ